MSEETKTPRKSNPVAQAVGDAIQLLRLERGWTNAELAKRVGTHRPLVVRAQRGAHTLRLEVIIRYCDAFGVKPSAFLKCIDGVGLDANV